MNLANASPDVSLGEAAVGVDVIVGVMHILVFLSLISRVFDVEYQWGDETYAGGPSVESLKLLETAYAFVVQETVILDRTIWIYQRHLNKEIIRYFRPSAQM